MNALLASRFLCQDRVVTVTAMTVCRMVDHEGSSGCHVCVQAKVFKGAFEARKEKGLWGGPADGGTALRHKGAFAQLWAALAGLFTWFCSLFGIKTHHG